MGEGEWQGESVVDTVGVEEGQGQGDTVGVRVEVGEEEGQRVEVRVGVKVSETVKDREVVGVMVGTEGVGEGEAALGDTGALGLTVPVPTLTVEEGEPTVIVAGGEAERVPVAHCDTLPLAL